MKPDGEESGPSKWYGVETDSEDDLVTDYLVVDESIGRGGETSPVPIFRVMPQLERGGEVLVDNIRQLHYIHECVQSMRDLMPPPLAESRRLCTSCPTLDEEENQSEPETVSASLTAARTPDWLARDVVDGVDGGDQAKHRSCSALDDLCFGQGEVTRRLAGSLSSFESDRDEGTSEKTVVATTAPSLAQSDPAAARPSASLHRSISTPSKISISKTDRREKARSDDEVLANLLEAETAALTNDGDLPEKRRKRGSMFFRKKKDKVKKLYRRSHHHRAPPPTAPSKYLVAEGWSKGKLSSTVSPSYYTGIHNAGYVSGSYSDGAPLLQYEFLEEPLVPVVDLDSDPYLALQADEPDSWTPTVPKELLDRLTKKDVKRQEHYYEFILTEKHHCLTLRVMQKIFVEGLHKYLRFGSNVDSLFPRLGELMTIHFEFLRQLRSRQRENPVIQSLGDILLLQFGGQPAERLKSVYGEFCSNHRNAINMYKYFMQNDSRFSAFVKHCETNPLLKKKGIPECVLFVTQRLTKYPLLIEPLIKSALNGEECEKLVKALALIKEILIDVNSQVADNEKEDRKFEIHDRIDAKTFTSYRGRKFKKSDLLARNRCLRFEGIATLMQGRGKMQVVLVLVLSDVLCFLSESNNKYSFFTPDSKEGVVSLQKLLVREKAGQESRVIYLISTNPAEMFELKVHNPKHKQGWIKAIREAVQRCPDDEGDGEARLPDERQFESQRKHVQQMAELLKQNDKQLAEVLEEKMVLQTKLVAGFEMGRTLLRPNYTSLVSESLNNEQIRKTVDEAIKNANQITKCLCSASLSRSVSSVGEHQSEAYKSPALPKRADTFSGFDSNPVRGLLGKKPLTEVWSEGSLDCLEYQAAVSQLSNYIYSMSCIVSQQMTSIVSLESELMVLRLHSGGPEHRRNQQLEELRNLQDKLQSERELWQRQREAEAKELEQRKEELGKLQEHIKESQVDIAQQREQLYRKLEALGSQGIVVGPLVTSSPDNASTFSSTLPCDKRKDPFKWKTAPVKDNTFPRNLISATNQQKVPATVSVKQQLPLKLSSRSSTGSVSPSPHDSSHQLLPLKLREDERDLRRSGGYQRLSSGQSPPQHPGHSRTSSSPAMMQNALPTRPPSTARKSADRRVKPEGDKTASEEEIIYC